MSECGCDRDHYCACLSGSCRCLPGQCECSNYAEAVDAWEGIIVKHCKTNDENPSNSKTPRK